MKSLHVKDIPAKRASGQSTAEVLMERAYALIGLRRWTDAISLLQQTLATEPDHYDALCALGECLRSLGRTDEALSYLERAAARMPGEQQAFSLMAWALVDKSTNIWRFRVRLRRRCRKRALEMARTAIKLEPESPQALAAMTGALFNTFRSARKAIPYIERHLRAQPDQHFAYGNMAAAKFRLRKWKEAESFARQALEINPQAVNTMATLGAVLIAKRRYREAIKVLNQALAINPDHPLAKSNLALAARKLLKEASSADRPDGTQKSPRQIKIEGGVAIMVVALFLLVAFLVRRFWMKGSTYQSALGACIMFAALPSIIGFTIWRRREFKRLPKGTQMLLQKTTKRKYPWLP